MKNRLFKFHTFVKLMIIIAIIGFTLWILFCFELNSGYFADSSSPKEAKELGVFVSEFKANKDSVFIAGNDYLTFGNIWIEKQWIIGNRCNKVQKIIENGRKLIIEVPKNKQYIVDRYFGHKYPIYLLIKNVDQTVGFPYLNEKWYLSFYYKQKEAQEEYFIRVVKPSDTIENNYVPQNLTNPIVIDSFYLIKKNKKFIQTTNKIHR